MGGLFKAGSAFHMVKEWTSSSRPRTTPFDKLEGGGAKMTAAQRAAFLAREQAKETSGNGLQAATTPLSSRYT